MKVLLCIAFAIAWPLFMWLFAASAISFVTWDNHFVIGLGEWGTGPRAAFGVFWTAAVLAFSLEVLVPDVLKNNS
jgi:hypothetical protein